MKFLELIKKRYSVRSYQNKKVEKVKIERCIEAARLAPSACNAQPWKFIVVDDPLLKEKVAKATFGNVISFNHFTMQAPVMIVIAAEKPAVLPSIGSQIKNLPYYLMDIGMAAEHFCLQAAEEGLGSCMLGWFNEKSVKKTLSIPKSRKIALLLTLGYPAKEETPKKIRKEPDQISSYNIY